MQVTLPEWIGADEYMDGAAHRVQPSLRTGRHAGGIESAFWFDGWPCVLGSERLTGALLDRLTHHVHMMEMNGESYRLVSLTRNPLSSGNQLPPDTDIYLTQVLPYKPLSALGLLGFIVGQSRNVGQAGIGTKSDPPHVTPKN